MIAVSVVGICAVARRKVTTDDYVLIFDNRFLLFPHCKCLKITRLTRLCNKYWKSLVARKGKCTTRRIRMTLISELEEFVGHSPLEMDGSDLVGINLTRLICS